MCVWKGGLGRGGMAGGLVEINGFVHVTVLAWFSFCTINDLLVSSFLELLVLRQNKPLG